MEVEERAEEAPEGAHQRDLSGVSRYYELAKRYPLPSGELFQGFVPASADKIFESTDAKR